MRSKVLIFMIAGAAVFACGCNNSGHSGKLLAKVGKARLYESDLALDIRNNKDSAAIVKKMVEDWVKQQLVFKMAMNELSSTEKNKDKQVNDYYQSLINYDYLQKRTAADTGAAINESDLKAYYDENQKNFELKRNIIRFLYVKIPVEIPAQPKIKEWMQAPGRQNIDSLKGYARRYASNYSFDTTRWYYFSDITKEIPILQDYSPEHFIKGNRFAELKDNRYHYMITIVDGRIKDDIAPYTQVRERIRTIIVNRRKTDALKQMENKIYRDAGSRHQFDIYLKDNSIQ